jgi:hypothetical protein
VARGACAETEDDRRGGHHEQEIVDSSPGLFAVRHDAPARIGIETMEIARPAPAGMPGACAQLDAASSVPVTEK